MMDFEDVQRYLPQYLSDKSQDTLFNELKQFPSNLDTRIYSNFLKNTSVLYQGDGVAKMMVINLPEQKTGLIPSMILSNTCDIDPSNKRFFPTRIVYVPIFKLEQYKNAITQNNKETSKDKITQHIESIKKQRISNIFYLPKGEELEEDSIAVLDRTNNYSSSKLDQDTILSRKLFTLSDYGFYLFLIKLSIHFTRVQEGIERTHSFSSS